MKEGIQNEPAASFGTSPLICGISSVHAFEAKYRYPK
jgi:hypothetical protein